jgi:small subunit ribosomal protein S7e
MAAINKIATNSPSRQNPSELETAIAGALFDLESNTQDLKASLRPLQFVSAREVRLNFFSDNQNLQKLRRRNSIMR